MSQWLCKDHVGRVPNLGVTKINFKSATKHKRFTNIISKRMPGFSSPKFLFQEGSNNMPTALAMKVTVKLSSIGRGKDSAIAAHNETAIVERYVRQVASK
jgi:hypothetical protein